MKRWMAFAAALALALTLPLETGLAGGETPAAIAFGEVPDQELSRAVWDGMRELAEAMDEVESDSEMTALLSVCLETAGNAFGETQKRFAGGLIDASVYENLTETVRDQYAHACESALSSLDRMLFDEGMDAGDYLRGVETVLGRMREGDDLYLDALNRSVQAGIMDETEYSGAVQETLSESVQLCQDALDIAEELMEEEMVPAGTFLTSAEGFVSAGLRLLDRRTRSLTELYQAGGLEEEAYFKGLEDVITTRTDWIQGMTEPVSGMLERNMLNEREQVQVSEYLLDITSGLIGEYVSYLDGMRAAGRMNESTYNLLRSVMEEVGKGMAGLSEEISGVLPAA